MAARILAALATIFLVAWGLFALARDRLRARPALRAPTLALGGLALIAAVVLWIALPTVVPDTPGSPAALVFSLAGWGLIGLLGLSGLIATAAAIVR